MWWASVEEKREDGIPASRRDRDDDDDDRPDMQHNELATAMKRTA